MDVPVLGTEEIVISPPTSRARSFMLAERLHMELRAESFNALNHSNWGTPNRFVNTPQFGTITEASTPGREFQLSARLSF